MYVEDPFESKYQLLISGRVKQGLYNQKIQEHSLIIAKEFMIFMKI